MSLPVQPSMLSPRSPRLGVETQGPCLAPLGCMSPQLSPRSVRVQSPGRAPLPRDRALSPGSPLRGTMQSFCGSPSSHQSPGGFLSPRRGGSGFNFYSPPESAFGLSRQDESPAEQRQRKYRFDLMPEEDPCITPPHRPRLSRDQPKAQAKAQPKVRAEVHTAAAVPHTASLRPKVCSEESRSRADRSWKPQPSGSAVGSLGSELGSGASPGLAFRAGESFWREIDNKCVPPPPRPPPRPVTWQKTANGPSRQESQFTKAAVAAAALTAFAARGGGQSATAVTPSSAPTAAIAADSGKSFQTQAHMQTLLDMISSPAVAEKAEAPPPASPTTTPAVEHPLASWRPRKAIDSLFGKATSGKSLATAARESPCAAASGAGEAPVSGASGAGAAPAPPVEGNTGAMVMGGGIPGATDRNAAGGRDEQHSPGGVSPSMMTSPPTLSSPLANLGYEHHHVGAELLNSLSQSGCHAMEMAERAKRRAKAAMPLGQLTNLGSCGPAL